MAATGCFCAEHAARNEPTLEPNMVKGVVLSLKNSFVKYLSSPYNTNHLGRFVLLPIVDFVIGYPSQIVLMIAK